MVPQPSIRSTGHASFCRQNPRRQTENLARRTKMQTVASGGSEGPGLACVFPIRCRQIYWRTAFKTDANMVRTAFSHHPPDHSLSTNCQRTASHPTTVSQHALSHGRLPSYQRTTNVVTGCSDLSFSRGFETTKPNELPNSSVNGFRLPCRTQFVLAKRILQTPARLTPLGPNLAESYLVATPTHELLQLSDLDRLRAHEITRM